MAKSQVIYLPTQRRETLGSDFGGLIGAAIGANMQQKVLEQQKERAMLLMDGIRKAPNRASAFEVVSNFSPMFKKPEDYTAALGLVDRVHPASEETVTPLTAYSDSTGAPTTVFANRKQMADPNFWKSQASNGLTLTKPDMQNFYAPAGATTTGPDVKDLIAPGGTYDPATWGKRPDGSVKGSGFLGVLKIPGTNSVASEYSVGVPINGKEMDIPTLVPTLSRQEVETVLKSGAEGKPPPDSIIQKAQQFAEQRIKDGKPVFAGPGEDQPTNIDKAGGFTFLGKLPVNKRPPGALTQEEIALQQKGRSEARQDRNAARADERLAMSQETANRAAARSNEILARIAENQDSKEVARGQSAMTSFTRLAATSLNAKALPDGTWDFGGDANKADQFTKMIEYANTRVESNPKILNSPTAVTRLFTEARKAVIAEKPADNTGTPAPKKEDKSGITKAKDWAGKVWKDATTDPGTTINADGKRVVKGSSDATKMSSEDAQKSVANAQAAATRVRASNMSVDDKAKALATIRQRLKDAGITGEIQ